MASSLKAPRSPWNAPRGVSVRLFMGVGIPERIIAASAAVYFAFVMPKVAAGFDENSVLDWV
jgi:hypothetical protein